MPGLCLDTNIASRIASHGEVLETLGEQFELFLPAPALVEIVRGFERSDPDTAATRYEDLVDQLDEFAVAVAPFDQGAARVAGQLLARRRVAPPDARSD